VLHITNPSYTGAGQADTALKGTIADLIPSPYIDRRRRELSDSEEKERYPKEPRGFKNAMIDSGLGFGSRTMAYILTIRKDGYPEAFEAESE
jgi:hypothetical protein